MNQAREGASAAATLAAAYNRYVIRTVRRRPNRSPMVPGKEQCHCERHEVEAVAETNRARRCSELLAELGEHRDDHDGAEGPEESAEVERKTTQ